MVGGNGNCSAGVNTVDSMTRIPFGAKKTKAIRKPRNFKLSEYS